MLRLHLDWLLVLPSILLLLLGLTILKSVAPDLVTQQAVIMLVGLLMVVFLALTNYQVFAGFSWYLYFLALIFLIITLIIGQTTRGSVRWIPLGAFRLQTSEIAKPLLILFFASFCSRHSLQEFKKLFLLLILFLLPTFLVFRQPDLGSALVVASLWLGIVFSAGIPLKFLSLGLVSTGISLPVFWHFLKGYQRVRLTNFINPLTDPLKGGYHLLQSIIAVGSGKFFGRGLGQGTQSQLRFLPESHTDFIFASLGEELGFLGTSLLICLYGLMFLGILRAAKKSPDQFGQLICVGVFSMFLFQVFINIGMNIGLVPITGITLPFISFGGSSLLSSLISLGLVISVSLRSASQEMFEIN